MIQWAERNHPYLGEWRVELLIADVLFAVIRLGIPPALGYELHILHGDSVGFTYHNNLIDAKFHAECAVAGLV